MKFNCIAYGMTDRIAVWEIEKENCFDYYVQVDDGDLLFSFGSSKDNADPRFTKDQLLSLFYDGHFDDEIGRSFR